MITAFEIKTLLKEKHSKDVCIPECKTGATWFDPTCVRLDFVAIKRSWKNPVIYGYEIKSTRGDFLRDTKWRIYLKYCTDFYFVCNQGVIKQDELPEEAGLIVTSKTGKRLFTKKRAPSRGTDTPIDMFKYIIISRSVISKGDLITNEDMWSEWLKRKDEKKDLGFRVSKKIRQLVEQRIQKVNEENKKLKNLMLSYDQLKQNLDSLGITDKIVRCSYTQNLTSHIADLVQKEQRVFQVVFSPL